MLYVGVDAHKAHSQMMVMDHTGKILKRRRVASSREGVLEALEPHRADGGQPIKAVLEAGYGWGAIYDWIGEVADEVILAHPLKVRAIAEARIKTDKLDSEMLAHLLRADLIPEAYAPSKETRATKRVLRQRMFEGAPANDGQKPRLGAPLAARDRATPSERPVRQEGSHMAQGGDRTA
jgi:transposase